MHSMNSQVVPPARSGSRRCRRSRQERLERWSRALSRCAQTADGVLGWGGGTMRGFDRRISSEEWSSTQSKKRRTHGVFVAQGGLG